MMLFIAPSTCEAIAYIVFVAIALALVFGVFKTADKLSEGGHSFLAVASIGLVILLLILVVIMQFYPGLNEFFDSLIASTCG